MQPYEAGLGSHSFSTVITSVPPLPPLAEALPDEYVLPAERPVPDLCSKGGSTLLMSDLGSDF